MTTPHTNNPHAPRRRSRAHGLSIIELLTALAITAVLLTATMVALNASFKAYADVAEQSSTQASTRMVTERLLTLLRTSTAQGPLAGDTTVTPNAVLTGNIIASPYVELIDTYGNLQRIDYDSTTNQLELTFTPYGSTTPTYTKQPILGGVSTSVNTLTNSSGYAFFLQRQLNNEHLWVLQRCTMDITVTPGADATLGLEHGNPTQIRIIGSTMPRKNPA